MRDQDRGGIFELVQAFSEAMAKLRNGMNSTRPEEENGARSNFTPTSTTTEESQKIVEK